MSGGFRSQRAGKGARSDEGGGRGEARESVLLSP